MWRRQAICVLMFAGALCGNLRGERVGFKFTGALESGTTGSHALFGIDAPGKLPISGTFSYDTTTEGIETEPGIRTFPQFIQGGYNLDINNGAIRLSTSEYVVMVADDFQRFPEDVDLISVELLFPRPTAPILVNGVPWNGAPALLRVELSWPSSAFEGPDEPKLAPDRPLSPDPGVSAIVGNIPTPRTFKIDSISAIAPLAGDYNRDGNLDTNDFAEWRRAFGQAGEAFRYADGNADGVVDMADYVVFRKGLAVAATGTGVLTLPEPGGLAVAAGVVISLAVFWSFHRGSCVPYSGSRRRQWQRVEPSL
jgi:hypothetical protein